jgi:transcriptional regulator with XRE-family HTH domain
MTARERARDRGHRLGLKALGAVAKELRTARLASGASQSAVGALAKVSHATEARYESGTYQGVTIVGAAELLAVVGLGISVSTYPLGDPPRDRDHALLGAAFLEHAAPPLIWRTEVPLPNAGDARSWDAMITGAQRRTGVEFERVIGDVQAQGRRIALKRRDGGVDYLLVVVADTPANRRALRQWQTFLPELPRLGIRQVLEALEAGRHPGDGLVLFRSPGRATAQPVSKNAKHAAEKPPSTARCPC